MKKLTFKSVTLALTLMLAACGSHKDTNVSGLSEPEYKISDADMNKWIIEKNKVEQCLFPRKGSAKNSKLSESNRFVYQMAAYNRTLSQIIGEDDYQTLMQDPASQQYLAERLAKLGHSKSVKIEKKWCNELRADYQKFNKATKTAKSAAKKATGKSKQAKKTVNKKSQKVARKEAEEKDIPYIGDINEKVQDTSSMKASARGRANTAEDNSYQEPKAPNGRIKVNWDPVKNEVYSY
ncbi:hypothetical protein APJL_1919 [Actinobacillus pleuropneumoniae serovar 3 str. JL03]|uniref:Lipoprotein n=1 Tax=Actinobacillus pleuropneumoniae serotype 3 (strain JL03) TaxID=434271 RepID=B0BTF5_ACTPJ|nr:DUF5358 family protein [Actinobacillus pleuropneumoniae]ABY70469.1 hypothetical protein APJL_1919 [Actinobacillus pleuropneumoniae serovar 3 str. JL03]UKH15376.1 hypothetical protein D1112_09800 [Actinobacillus pleuropneumoniae]UKH23548.1 hypothetical protein D1108_09765 [Actinobacillus pleuropneumoniae]UKH44553.1 hypothetical protein D1096_09720 [Actinobacillus pleuropneumoniae]USQ16510.1 hypothetical protein J3K87_10170 [Actinobacillus pleuropneumoniae]